MKKTLLILAMLVLPASVMAQGIIGECADCHTMHNSQQGQPVAMKGFADTASVTPNQNLLKFDCIACHAQDAAGAANIVVLSGGSQVPQVMHGAATDLAAGNFQHIATLGNTGRKGHNVQDLLLPAETDNITNKALVSGALYAVPPGQYYGYQDGHGKHLSSAIANGFDKFTCAGAGGCHGTRSQFQVTAELLCDADNILDLTSPCYGKLAGDIVATAGAPRKGIAAITGAHHESYDGTKEPLQVAVGEHDGAYLASSYRFLNGVKGYGNMAARWQNVSATSHNEYFGAQANAFPSGCTSCHVEGTDVGVTYDLNGGTDTTSKRMTADSTLKAPNQSMSGFCTTCHGNFHSSSLETGVNYDRGPANGISGAFLRHPSDYVIPATGEYAAYTAYNTTAPVARPTVATAASALVAPGTDMVMCLSCHKAHATEHDGMLRFDYATMVAGNFADSATAQAVGGCMACHTTKGVNKQK